MYRAEGERIVGRRETREANGGVDARALIRVVKIATATRVKSGDDIDVSG